MLTTVMVRAILTVLQWVFWVSGALYLVAALSMLVRGDGEAVMATAFGFLLGIAGALCLFLRKQLSKKKP